MTSQIKKRFIWVLTAGFIAGAGFLTVGCTDGPGCEKSHIETRLQPVFNGKTTSMIMVPVAVCDS